MNVKLALTAGLSRVHDESDVGESDVVARERRFAFGRQKNARSKRPRSSSEPLKIESAGPRPQDFVAGTKMRSEFAGGPLRTT